MAPNWGMQSCVNCATHNVEREVQTAQAAHPPPDKPLHHLQMDFIELTQVRERSVVQCLVTKALTCEIIPGQGIPA